MVLVWEEIAAECHYVEGTVTRGLAYAVHRAKVPGGWLVMMPHPGSIIFYPDPNHEWDGNSLP